MNHKIISYEQLEQYKDDHPEIFIDDHIDLAIEELFDIEYPSKKDSKTKEEVESFKKDLVGGDENNWGTWVYYPWLNRAVHFPPKDKLRALRTSRNRNLITSQEQLKLYSSTLLIIGMSVGSNVVEALVSQGIGSTLVLVDMDKIEPSNLNRIRSPYHHVDLHKVEAISRKVLEIDPYIQIISYNDGLNESNIESILADHKVNVIVDEMDELKMKIKLREAAKKYKLPVVMAADDGDNALIDIERYDKDSDLELFSGRIPAETIDRIKNEKIARAELGMMIGRYFVGPDNIPLRMYRSLKEVGKTLPSWPQLGGAAALSGISLTYVIRKILLDEYVFTGRHLVSLDEKLGGSVMNEIEQQELNGYINFMEGNSEK
jgi:molybdopterin/thiamine biosynthesis adenylyltransferase